MAGFIEKIMGMFSAPGKAEPVVEKKQMIGDYAVFATPIREGAQFRTAGRIEAEVNGVVLVRRFIRADIFASETDAVDTSFRKARQIIEQNGAGLFGDGAAERQV